MGVERDPGAYHYSVPVTVPIKEKTLDFPKVARRILGEGPFLFAPPSQRGFAKMANGVPSARAKKQRRFWGQKSIFSEFFQMIKTV